MLAGGVSLFKDCPLVCNYDHDVLISKGDVPSSAFFALFVLYLGCYTGYLFPGLALVDGEIEELPNTGDCTILAARKLIDDPLTHQWG